MRKVLAKRLRSACFVSKSRARMALFPISIPEYYRAPDIFFHANILLFFSVDVARR